MTSLKVWDSLVGSIFWNLSYFWYCTNFPFLVQCGRKISIDRYICRKVRSESNVPTTYLLCLLKCNLKCICNSKEKSCYYWYALEISERPKRVNTEYTKYRSFGILTELNWTESHSRGKIDIPPRCSIFLFFYFYVTIFKNL